MEFNICYAGRVVEQQQVICAVLLDSQDRVVRSLLPDGAEWSVIEELMVILKPFALATTVLSGSSYGTISIVSPLIHKFCSNLDRKEDDCENLKQIKVAIQSDLQGRYVGDTAKLLQEAAFLDPRFKQLNFLSDDERRDTIERMKVKMLLAASDGLCHVRSVKWSPAVKWSIISPANPLVLSHLRRIKLHSTYCLTMLTMTYQQDNHLLTEKRLRPR